MFEFIIQFANFNSETNSDTDLNTVPIFKLKRS